MTVEDIYKRLMAGENDCDIAAELVGMLNEAVNMKEKEEAAASKREDEMHAAAQTCAEAYNDFLRKYCDYDNVELTADDFITLGNFLKDLKIEVKKEDTPTSHSVTVKAHTPKMASFNPDSIIDEFLGSFKLK